MNLLRSVIPDALQPAYRALHRTVYSTARRGYGAIRYRGTSVTCPCCGWTGREFLPMRERTNAVCPKCGSLERHRFLSLHLDQHLPALGESPRILHFAPEPMLSRKLRKLTGSNYVTTDLVDSGVDVAMDITDLQFADGSFDCVICSHILEHIPDEATALSEIHRVLAPGGFALILVPIYETPNGATIEDPAVTSARDRLRLYGQPDHVRKYGNDFRDRLAIVGWQITEHSPDNLSADITHKHGLVSGDGVSRERIHHCTKV